MNRGISRDATLIVFCREPIPGRTKTRLIPQLGATRAAELADAFILDALAKCRALAPRQLVIAANAPAGAKESRYFRRLARRFGAQVIDQGTGSLGKRMERSLAPFSQDAAVLIGTDTPTLPIDLIARSAALLRHTRVVLAPTLDGGYYLVAVRGIMPDIFRAVAWGRASVLDETIARLRRQRVNYALGPGWYDVDRWSDVLSLTAHLRVMIARQPRESRPITQRRPSTERAVSNRAQSTNLAAIPCPATATVLHRLGLLSIDD